MEPVLKFPSSLYLYSSLITIILPDFAVVAVVVGLVVFVVVGVVVVVVVVDGVVTVVVVKVVIVGK